MELKLDIDLFVDNVFPNVAFMTSSTGPCHTGWTATSLILLVASFAGRTSNQRIAITTERSGPSTTCTLQSLSPRIKVRNSLSPPTIANPSVCKKQKCSALLSNYTARSLIKLQSLIVQQQPTVAVSQHLKFTSFSSKCIESSTSRLV